MFSSALKSLSSNINSNYHVSTSPTTTSGPWKIYDAKKKSTNKSASVFVLDRKHFEAQGGNLGKSTASNLRKSIDEVVERLKREASSLARLRHPNILELVEPVEETRNGGLQFATEPVISSLSRLLQDNEITESRLSLHHKDSFDGSTSGSKLELDEIEIQKGLEQISKALEFLHDNAGLVHGNLTPDAVFINSKFDWKISGLSFLSPPNGSTKATSVAPILLSEALNVNPRIPSSVQINLDYCSPDLVLDSNLNFAADMFSLGLLIIAIFNVPHTSPLKAESSTTRYKQLFESQSTIPSASNGFLSSRPIPEDLASMVLPRLMARHPEQRMTAKEFQKSSYFDNVLISTIRFLDTLPAKTPNEKVQFMKGLVRVIPSFPKSILEKKILQILLETKDHDLLSLVLQNIFGIMEQLSSTQTVFTEKIMPKLREIFIPKGNHKFPPERDSNKEAGLMVVLGNLDKISQNCSAKNFKDYILPIVILAIESPTHSIVDTSLQNIHLIFPALDFMTIKNDLFPVIASVFSKTSNLRIKIRCLEAFLILCGGSNVPENINDGLDGVAHSHSHSNKQNSSPTLDKYTMQERILPLIRAIKTKEPAVAIAALNVLRQVGRVADTEFIAMDILPVLWSMSLGPLINLDQFRSFMELIKSLSMRVETEQTKRLLELSGSSEKQPNIGDSFFSSSIGTNTNNICSSDETETEFLRLVKGSTTKADSQSHINAGIDTISQYNRPKSMNFAWPASNSATTPSMASTNSPQQNITRQDLSRFTTLNPIATQYSSPLQPQNSSLQMLRPQSTGPITSSSGPINAATFLSMQPSLNWSSAVTQNAWGNSMTDSDRGRSSTPVSTTSMNSSLSQVSPVDDPRRKYSPNLYQPARNSQLELRYYNSSSQPLSASTSNHSISLPQLQPQNNRSSLGFSPIAQQNRGMESYSISPPSVLMQSQRSGEKNEWQVWESLL
ncbi:hypothetical protein K3495_g8647 [Podosphaera aphanis]|nr:hypothetical protein K3495_g8647 [Podosphaera aphanis]